LNRLGNGYIDARGDRISPHQPLREDSFSANEDLCDPIKIAAKHYRAGRLSLK